MWSIETSASQKAVHIDDLDSSLKANRRDVLMGKPTDWVIVDTAQTWEEAKNKAAFWSGVVVGKKDPMRKTDF